jgi:hypothetical protein
MRARPVGRRRRSSASGPCRGRRRTGSWPPHRGSPVRPSSYCPSAGLPAGTGPASRWTIPSGSRSAHGRAGRRRGASPASVRRARGPDGASHRPRAGRARRGDHLAGVEQALPEDVAAAEPGDPELPGLEDDGQPGRSDRPDDADLRGPELERGRPAPITEPLSIINRQEFIDEVGTIGDGPDILNGTLEVSSASFSACSFRHSSSPISA